MKVYKVTALFSHRTPNGSEFPVHFTATRQEARSVARSLVAAAASNPNLDSLPAFEAEIMVCRVTESLGKGRNLAVALLNGRGVVEDDATPVDRVSKPAQRVRCDGCGKTFTAQAMTPTGMGLLCNLCFDSNILFDPSALEISEGMIAATDYKFSRRTGGLTK